MSDQDGYFGEQVAATYDESASDEFEPATIARTVDLLAELAAGGTAIELAIGNGPDRAPSRGSRRSGARH